jgi:hypothetical protein
VLGEAVHQGLEPCRTTGQISVHPIDGVTWGTIEVVRRDAAGGGPFGEFGVPTHFIDVGPRLHQPEPIRPLASAHGIAIRHGFDDGHATHVDDLDRLGLVVGIEPPESGSCDPRLAAGHRALQRSRNGRSTIEPGIARPRISTVSDSPVAGGGVTDARAMP